MIFLLTLSFLFSLSQANHETFCDGLLHDEPVFDQAIELINQRVACEINGDSKSLTPIQWAAHLNRRDLLEALYFEERETFLDGCEAVSPYIIAVLSGSQESALWLLEQDSHLISKQVSLVQLSDCGFNPMALPGRPQPAPLKTTQKQIHGGTHRLIPLLTSALVVVVTSGLIAYFWTGEVQQDNPSEI